MTLKIPRTLYEKLQKIIEGTGYSSVTEFVVYVLRDLVSSDDFVKRNDEISELTEKEIKAIRKRLRNLGYLE
ncbi:MAG TPA: CopG family transcriptional regulator [Thermotogaceae bacterium]|nr:CopG family transcriptional regulator [Thermotogaceae bacterium]